MGTVSMDKSELQETLQQIHGELERAEAVDVESREMLVTVLHDIERVLAQEPDQEHDQPSSDTLVGQMRESMEHFEDTHPFLTSLIGRIADGLSNMGI